MHPKKDNLKQSQQLSCCSQPGATDVHLYVDECSLVN